MTGRARDMITDPEQTGRLREVIAEGEFYGMQTFDQALLRHYQAGRVSLEDALRVSTSPHDFKLLVAGDGRTATSMDDIVSDRSRRCVRWRSPPAVARTMATATPQSSRRNESTRPLRADRAGRPPRRRRRSRPSNAVPAPPIAGHRFASVRKALR